MRAIMGSGKVLKSKHANEMIIYIWDKLIKEMLKK